MSDFTYRLMDCDGALLYVGYTINPIRRLSQHQTKEWWPDVRSVNWTQHPDRQTALNEERRQILQDSPRHNTAVFRTIGGKTKVRGIRVKDELWHAAQQIAADTSSTRTSGSQRCPQ